MADAQAEGLLYKKNKTARLELSRSEWLMHLYVEW